MVCCWVGSYTERGNWRPCEIKNNISYKNALRSLSMESLESRRNKLCLKFGKKAEKHEKHRKWFKLEVKARLNRFKKSPLSFLTDLLNANYSKKKKWIHYIPIMWIIVARMGTRVLKTFHPSSDPNSGKSYLPHFIVLRASIFWSIWSKI